MEDEGFGPVVVAAALAGFRMAELSLDSTSKGYNHMTNQRYHTVLAASAIILIAPTARAAGVYSSATGQTPSAFDNPIRRSEISIWENAVVSYTPAPGVSATGNPNTGLVSLGDLSNPVTATAGPKVGLIGIDVPGSITLSFASSIYDGPGADFAVFEQGFTGSNDTLFAEFAYVEVSSDGVNFARFDSISLNTAPTSGTGAFAFYDMTNVYNLAGKHAANWGTPFDLSQLAGHNLVLNGILDLGAIGYVRLVDVVGSGLLTDGEGDEIPGIAKDSLGNPIRDNWVTTGSGGFDYVGLPTGAIGVLNSVPEPVSMTISVIFAGLSLTRRRR